MKRLLWVLPLLLVAGITAAPPSLPQPAAAAISTVLKSATDRGDVPGVVVAVVNKDTVLYNEASGKSSTLRNTPMTKDTIFNMASMTKPVTSVAIMMLVDEGKLKLDDEVAKYLPKWKDPVVISKFNEADASYETRPARRPITIRHLLTHTSGIGYGFASPMLTKIMEKTKKAELDLPLLFDPGDSWAYGASTRVLGHVVEAISGQKIDASPSLTSNQSLPRASTMLGLCVMRKLFLPLSGVCASILRKASARLLFSSGVTTSPPSVRSIVVSMSSNPARMAVS